MKKVAIIFILISTFTSSSSFVFGWETLKNDHFTIFYKSEYENQAWNYLKALEYYRPKVEKLIGNSAYHLPIVIEDVGTMSNGLADPFNYRIFLCTYPPGSGLLGTGLANSVENWPAYAGVHEYTHLLHLTKTGGFARLLKIPFGNLFMPNLYSLGWAIEGIAVYSESQMSKYQGRLNDGYYDAYIGARVKDNRFPSILEAAYPPFEYPYGDGIYNYGGVFFDYLSKSYGEEKFAQFFKKYGSSMPIFMFNRSAKKVYGKSFSKLWKEWEEYESDRFKNFGMEGEKLTDHGWYISDTIFHNNKLYYARMYAEKTGAFKGYGFFKIMEKVLQTGEEKCIVSARSSFATPIKIHSNKLYYAVLEQKPGHANVSLNSYGAFSIVHERDLATGDDNIIMKDGIRDFEILNGGSILYSRDREDGFGSEIGKYDRIAGENKILFISDYLITRIVRNKSRLIVSARKDWENFSLYGLDLEKQEFTPVIHTPYFEGNHTLYGDKVFFTANYEGIYSSYCYQFSTGKTYRLTENGYSTSPVYNEENETLYYIGLNSYGYDIYAKPAEWKEFHIPDYVSSKPPEFSLDESKVRRGGYLDNVKTVYPKLRLPLLISDEKGSKLGLILIGQDALVHFPYVADFWYDFEEKDLLYNAEILPRMFAPLKLSISSSNSNSEGLLSFNIEYPIISRLSTALSDISLGLSSRLFEDFDRHELTPYITTGFQFPTTSLGLKLKFPVEREQIGSDVNRMAIVGKISLSKYIKKSAANISISSIYDPDNTYNPETDSSDESPLPVIRGYDDPLKGKIGAVFSADISAPILPVRKGLWFPPYIFVEDICGDIFLDGVISKEKDYQLSTGLELHLETNVSGLIPLDIGARFVINRDRDFKVLPIINISGIF